MAYDPRIGVERGDGVEWPATDIAGRNYTRPPAIKIGLGSGRFVVAPVGWKDTENVIDTLRAKYQPPQKSKRQEADEKEDGGE